MTTKVVPEAKILPVKDLTALLVGCICMTITLAFMRTLMRNVYVILPSGAQHRLPSEKAFRAAHNYGWQIAPVWLYFGNTSFGQWPAIQAERICRKHWGWCYSPDELKPEPYKARWQFWRRERRP